MYDPPRATVKLLVAVALGAAAGPAAGQEAATSYAFENVTVVPMVGERTLPGHTVVVRDGRIVEVGPSAGVQVPADALRIDGEGRYLAPGLAEMHARLPAEDDPLRVVVLEEALFLYLANGVTTIRGMAGSPYQLELREQIARGEILGPTLYPGSPSLDGAGTPDAASAEAQARAHAAAGYSFLTVDAELPADAWGGVAAAAAELGLSFGGRLPAAVGVERALADGVSTIDGLDAYLAATRRDGVGPDAPLAERLGATDRTKLEALARATAEAGAYVVPAQHLSNHLAGWNQLLGGRVEPDSIRKLPDYRYVPQTRRDAWSTDAFNRWSDPALTPEASRAHAAWRRDLLGALHAAGAKVLLGTISPALFNVPGFAVHREMPLMVEAGMTPFEVLASATTTAARYVEEELGQEADFGTVTVGARADLLLLDADPLASVATLQDPAGVMARGRWLPRLAIQERLAAIATRHKDYDTD